MPHRSDTTQSHARHSLQRGRGVIFLTTLACLSAALTASGQTTPARPTNLVAIATATNQIALTWTDTATNETGFKIERSLDDVAWAQIGTVNSNVPAYSATGLAVAVKHYFRVRAFNGAGDSADSNTNAATTLAPLEAWRRAKFTASELTNPAISGPFADPDGDSLPNVSEFGWAREPLAADCDECSAGRRGDERRAAARAPDAHPHAPRRRARSALPRRGLGRSRQLVKRLQRAHRAARHRGNQRTGY